MSDSGASGLKNKFSHDICFSSIGLFGGMMKIFITGANGQLAREFQESLKDFNYDIPLDRDASIYRTLTLSRRLFRHNPDVVLNCAAYNLVDKAEEDFDAAYKVNAIGVRNLASACKRIMLYWCTTAVIMCLTGKRRISTQKKMRPIRSIFTERQIVGRKFFG